MKKVRLNKKGFTLIELLAVIVILGVLLAIAIPSVTKYINISKKSTYIDNVQAYASTALDQATLGTYKFPVNPNEATVIFFDNLIEHLNKGGKVSPYGAAYVADSSFIVIANTRTAEDPHYETYIAAIDEDGYGIGTIAGNTQTPGAIAYDGLTSANIIQISSGAGMAKPTVGGTVTTEDGNFNVTTVY